MGNKLPREIALSQQPVIDHPFRRRFVLIRLPPKAVPSEYMQAEPRILFAQNCENAARRLQGGADRQAAAASRRGVRASGRSRAAQGPRARRALRDLGASKWLSASSGRTGWSGTRCTSAG